MQVRIFIQIIILFSQQPLGSLCLLEDITIDPHTAHPRLVISVDGKQVHCGDRHQLVPDNPERFDRVVCALARQGFSSGRHYWEVGGAHEHAAVWMPYVQ